MLGEDDSDKEMTETRILVKKARDSLEEAVKRDFVVVAGLKDLWEVFRRYSEEQSSNMLPAE